MKRWFQANKIKIIFLFWCFIASIIIAEFLLRLVYTPSPVLELGDIRPWEDYEYSPKPNPMGFREGSLNEIIFQEEYVRILFLGDSFTFGQGVEKGESLFPDIIERRLNSTDERKGPKTRYHIFNAGWPGGNPKTWYSHLVKLFPIYQPDYVFAIFFLRDGTPLCSSLRCWEEVIEEIKSKYTGGFLYRHTSLGRLIGDNLVKKKFSNHFSDQFLKAYLGSGNDKKMWNDQQSFLLMIRDVCKQNGIDFHLILFPLLFNLDSHYQFYGVEDKIIHFAEIAQIPVFSLTPGFIGHADHTLWVSLNDQHPNEKGHRIAADTLAPYVWRVVNPSPGSTPPNPGKN